MIAIRKLIDAILYPNGHGGIGYHEETPREVLDALEWTESDTGDDLAERAETVEDAQALSAN
jgi:hypothetical protein